MSRGALLPLALLVGCAAYRAEVEPGAVARPPLPMDAPVQVAGGELVGATALPFVDAVAAACPGATAARQGDLRRAAAQAELAGGAPAVGLEQLATVRFAPTGSRGALAASAELVGLARATARRLGGAVVLLRRVASAAAGSDDRWSAVRAEVYAVDCADPTSANREPGVGPPDL